MNEEITKGGVTVKTINGKKYYYYQWYENGKRRSKTITEEEYYEYKTKYLDTTSSTSTSAIKVLTGDLLKNTISIVRDYKKRECYKNINDYINGSVNGKVLILYGLRRTGKTSLIFQSILNLDSSNFNKAAYLLVSNGADLGKLNIILNDLYKQGYKYVYIDEATLMPDFISGAQFISDVYANVMKIVISGTDSLGLLISSYDQLYDRCIMIHTTYISYKEFSEVLGIKDIDTYIEYGGTMIKEGYDYHHKTAPVFYDEKSTLNYVDTSIVRNILRTLDNYKNGNNYERIKELKDKNDLTGIINRIIQDMNHKFISSVLSKEFKSHDYGSLKELMRKNTSSDYLQTFLDKDVDEEKIYKDLMDRLDIDKDKYYVDDSSLKELMNYLYELEVVSNVDIIDIDNNIKRNRIVFTQPGLRYSLAKSLIESLISDEHVINLPEYMLNILISTLLNDVKGRMLEDIVLLETKKRNNDLSFKAEFQFKEIDMVIYHKDTNTCSIYEIKHSKDISKMQYRHLIDDGVCNQIEERYGRIEERVVLYRGENKMVDNIKYANVEEYLMK